MLKAAQQQCMPVGAPEEMECPRSAAGTELNVRVGSSKTHTKTNATTQLFIEAKLVLSQYPMHVVVNAGWHSIGHMWPHVRVDVCCMRRCTAHTYQSRWWCRGGGDD